MDNKNTKSNISKGLASQSVKSFGRMIDNPGDLTTLVLILSVLGLITFLGAFSIKIFFRKAPMLFPKNLFLIILSTLTFIGFGIFEFSFIDKESSFGTSDSFLVTGSLSIVLGLCIFIKSIKFLMKKSSFETISILSVLAKEGWSENKIRTVGEPLLVLILGIVYCFYNLLGGAVLIFCAISAWIHVWIDSLSNKNSLEKRIDPNVINMDDYSNFNEVK